MRDNTLGPATIAERAIELAPGHFQAFSVLQKAQARLQPPEPADSPQTSGEQPSADAPADAPAE